ncbi:hypothetical protein M2280_003683 [Prescottella agglutinans]|uniref:Uncharacterized protein n=1 Tax=Prescottella agglutinans TaxID=1644129 RepID=A0ABT6MDQ5_9NOCA|nr:hypothetical protein [Prescottella agglutinans]
MLSIQNATSSLGQTVEQMLPIMYVLLVQMPVTLSLGTPA